jgi:transcriptional regulator with XRE-family HTH domain
MNTFLRQAMRDRGWTIPQLAEACEVAVGLAQRWVSENPHYRVTPNPLSCAKIATALGVDLDQVLALAGHRVSPTSGRTRLAARLRAVEEQYERWIAAVGPENEEYFWRHLKVQGDSTVDLIRGVGVAVNTASDTAVSKGVSASGASDNALDGGADRALSADYRHRKFRLADAFRTTTSVAAA